MSIRDFKASSLRYTSIAKEQLMTTIAYISLSGDDLIRAYEMDYDGLLTHRQDVPVPGGPSALASAPNEQTLYCSLRASRELAAFRFEDAGALRLLNKRQLDADACYVAPDKTGSYLLAAYHRAGKVTVHGLESNGSIASEVCSVPTAARAHCIETDASNRYALVPHPLEANCVFQFLFDERTGRLTPNPAAPRHVAGEGDGPRHFVYSQDPRFVYTSNEEGSSVTAYHFNGPPNAKTQTEREDRTLRPFQTISSLPADFNGANTCAQIHLHPAGHTLYVSNRGHDSIAVFAIDTENGTLSRRGWQPTEAVPRVFNIDPSGRYLLAAGQGTGRAATYAIDPDSGSLAPLGVYDVGQSPMWVLFRQV